MREKFRKIWLTDPEDIKKEKIRSLFMQYLVIIGIAEILTFLLFWIFQVEEASPEMIANENIPFHWKAYFLAAFLIPVLVTFVLGFGIELKKRCDRIEDDRAARIKKLIWPYGFPGKRKILLWFLAATGFVIFMLILGFSDMGVYGSLSIEAFAYFCACVSLIVFIIGLAMMIMKYKTRSNALKAEYSKAISRHLGFPNHDTGGM